MSHAVSRGAEAIYDWFFRPIDSRVLAMARIGFGLTLAIYYLQLTPYVQTFFGPDGIAGHAALAAHPDFAGLLYDRYAKFRVLHHIESRAVVWGLWLAVVVASLCFAAGFRTRLFGAFAVVLHVLFLAHAPHATTGWARMVWPWMAYVAAGAPAHALSVDGWISRRRGQSVDPERIFQVRPWAMRLLQIHLCTMYLDAGWERLDHANWLQGEMVFHAAAAAPFGRYSLDWYAMRPALEVVTYCVFLLEPLAPILLWIPRIGRYYALVLVGMHVGIELSSETGYWQFWMIAALFVFMPPTWFRWMNRVARRTSGS